ncbi:hypothetical protein [Acidisoma silvae]|uniref:Uncharacterized protein n=1 Tax=Acidisoma silvae TaxID=2802396 RepID=A0A964DXC2_9PROT|nr:hypothetical protein [Acidisoma silvae]MCB8874140.1 hypothetical protein [Acidisoma silvae]
MKYYLPAAWLILACLSASIGLALAWFTPAWLLYALPLAPAAVALALTARFPAQATALWLGLLATCPEMWLGDIIRQTSAIIDLDKAAGLLLLVFCLFRYGARWDGFNPCLAFPFMWVAGYVHGVWPGLIWSDSLRSLIGSMAPFAFSFVRLPPVWCRLVIRTTIASPIIILGFGGILASAGLRPLYGFETGALRLGASTLPAFLAGFTLISLYALLVEQVRRPRFGLLVLLAGDILILLATGARAPLAIGLGLILLVTITVPHPPPLSWRPPGSALSVCSPLPSRAT